MWNYQKGHMKEIPLAGGVLSLAGTFNPLELVGDERTLVFAIVDLLREFERAQEHPVGAAGPVARARVVKGSQLNQQVRNNLEEPTDG